MLPRKNRVSRRDGVGGPRKTRATPHLLLTYRQHSTTQPRFTIVVSHRVHGRAVERNTVRRRLRAVIREAKKNLPPGAYHVRVLRPIETLTYSELVQEVHKLLMEELMR